MECGWVWSEVEKDVLRVLEELEPEPGKNSFYLYTKYLMSVS
jgi:hypothetical protein